MWGSKLLFVLLTCIYPDPVAESWSLFGSANESTCGLNTTCSEDEVRGVFPRPGFIDHFAQRISSGEWGWMMKFAWNFLGQIFLQGIVWCGTLCNFVGVAASWSYWLMVGVVAVFILQLGVWTVTWILLPIAQHGYALVQYLRGRAPWHEVASLHGLSTFRPSWVGPRAGTEWTSAYIQQEVRGRGDAREPHDLLVTDGLAVARLRHGTLRGRTNRHGFKCSCSGVHSSSHRYFRNQIESAGCIVHLCAEDPCGAPEEEGWHILASAVIPRVQAYDLQEAAGKGPWGRCLMATRFWGCRGCFCFTWIFKAIAWLTRRAFGCCCRPRRNGASSQAPTPKHEDSETESEAEAGEICQAERVAMLDNGHAIPLSAKPCKDVRKGTGIRILPSDLPYSSREELERDGEDHVFHACNHHRAMYENHATKKICVVEGCGAESKVMRGGLRLCKLHAVKEEKGKKSPGSSRDPVFGTDPMVKTELESHQPKGERHESEARFAPGPKSQPLEVEENDQVSSQSPPYEELGQYLRLLMQGKTAGSALGELLPPGEKPARYWNNLRKAASEYLPKLPEDYPPTARLGLVQIITEDPPVLAERDLDPILDLDHPTTVQKSLRARYKAVPDPLQPAVEDFRESEHRPRSRIPDEPEGRRVANTMDLSHLYRPKGDRASRSLVPTSNFSFRDVAQTPSGRSNVQSLAPPRPQDAFAAATRPRHMGAYTDGEPPAVDEATKALQTIAKTLTSRDEATGHERGKVSSISKSEERLVYLVRGCDALTVSVGSATVGKELYYALKATATQGRPQLRAIQFPVNIGNRVAFGLASMSIGGRDLKSIPDYSLAASDFPLTTEEDFDSYGGTADSKMEKRMKAPATLSHWYRNALRQSWAIACVYGAEHYACWEEAAGFLLRLGEDHGYAWPPHAIFGVWEELWARFTEEMRELDRALRREMREETPTFDRIRFFATSPDFNGDPWLSLPRTFFLEDEGEYFQTDVVPRHNRLLSRACWQTALRRSPINTLTGGKAGAEDSTGQDPGTEALIPRPEPRVGKGAGKDSPKLLGPALTGKEGARALDHRPKDKKSGKFLCWDHITHRGCKAGTCVHYHGNAPKWESMDWTVQLQLLRRGGLKNRPNLSNDQVTKQMENLRQVNKDKMAENVAEGKRAKGASGKGKDKEKVAGAEGTEEAGAKVGKGAPEEFTDFMPTEAEGELAQWIKGDGAKFLEDQEANKACRAVGTSVVKDPEATRRLELMKTIDDAGLTTMLEGDLATYVNNKLLLLKEEKPDLKLGPDSLRKAVEEARDLGSPEVSAMADQVLTNGLVGKVGFSQDIATLSNMVWADGVGTGTFRYLGTPWRVYDYGDQLPISPALGELLDLHDLQCQREEARQCLYLHCSAGVLLSKKGEVPTLEDVLEAATEVRTEVVWQAQEAAYHLGPCPEEVGKAEADLRTFAHDILHLDHDKDYRCLAAFPPSFFDGYTLCILRMDPQGLVTTEVIHNPGQRVRRRDVWLLVSKGHMRLLSRPQDCPVPKVVREVEAAGWEIHLEAVEGPEACVRARDLSKCPRCDEAAGDPLRLGDRGPTTLGLYPLPHPEQKIGGWVQGPLETKDYDTDYKVTDAQLRLWLGPQAHLFDKGLQQGTALVEVYAGKGRLSDAVLSNGGVAIKLGLDHGQDFRLAKDRAYAKALFKRLKPEHGWFAWPCAPFCAWMKLAVLRNCDVAPRLKEGRVHLRFSLELAEYQLTNRRHAHCENPLTSTAWREPNSTQTFSKPEWLRARLDQCTTGLVGPQGDLHLKPTLIRTTASAVAAALSLRCPADHPHELVQGVATSASAMYSPRLAKLAADIIYAPTRAGYLGGGGRNKTNPLPSQELG